MTRVRGIYLVHHGGDAPVPSGTDRVAARFGLRGKVVRHLLDDHERMLAGDPETVQAALGADLGPPRRLILTPRNGPAPGP